MTQPTTDEIFGGTTAPATTEAEVQPVEGSQGPGLAGAYDTLQAWANAGLRGATGGMAQAFVARALDKVNADWASAYRKGEEKLRTEHEGVSAAGEAAGMVAGAVASGGMSAGGLLEAGAVRALGGGGFARMLGSAAGATVDQAAYNAAKFASEQELGDHQINAEKLVAQMASKENLLEVLTAGGIGGAFGAAGAGLKKLAPMLKGGRGPASAGALDAAAGLEGAGRAALTEARAADDAVDALRKAGATSRQAGEMVATMDAVTKAGGDHPALVQSFIDFHAPRMADPDMAREAMGRIYRDGLESSTERAAKRSSLAMEAKTDFDAVLRAGDQLDGLQFGQKPEYVAKLADAANTSSARDAVASMVQQIDDVTRALDATIDKGGNHTALRKMQTQADELRRIMRGIGEGDDAAKVKDLFLAADRTKRVAQQIGKEGGYGAAPTLNAIRDLSETLRTGLENEGAWGKLGAVQRDFNRAFSENFEPAKMMGRQFGVVLEKDGFRPVVELNPQAFVSHLKAVGDPSASYVGNEAIDGFLQQVENRVNVARKYGLLSGADDAALKAAEASASKVRDTLKRATHEASVLNYLDKAMADEMQVGIGGMMGLGLDIGASPYKTLRRLAQVKRAVDTFDARFGTSVGDFFRAKPPSVGVARPRAAIVKEIEGVRAAQANPDAFLDRASSLVDPELQRVAPKHSAGIATGIGRMVSFLAMHAPKGQPPNSIIPGRGETRYSDMEITKYERAAEAVRDPAKVVEDASRGQLSREGVQALKYVYPSIYQNMRMQVMGQLEDMDRRGDLDKIPYQRRILLGMLLDIPADASLRPETVGALQKLKAQEAPQPQPSQPQGGGRRPYKLDTSIYRTFPEQIERGGRTAA